MLENDKNFNIPIHDPKHSSLSECNFDSLSKAEVIEKYETVLTSREKQIQDLSELIGNYSDKLDSSFERIKALEEENESLKEKLFKKVKFHLKKEQFIQQDQENKEIMFLRLKEMEKEVESFHQTAQRDRKSPIDSFLNFFSRTRSKSDANENNIEKHSFDKFNMTHESLNIEPLSTGNSKTFEDEEKDNKEETENIVTKQNVIIEEEALDKDKAVEEDMDVLDKLKILKNRKSKSGVIKEGKDIGLKL